MPSQTQSACVIDESVSPLDNTGPCWVEVSLNALRHNFRIIREIVRPQAEVCAVLKADGYGHGAVACAVALQREGASWFAVNTANEGALLRQAGVKGKILLLAEAFHTEGRTITKNKLTASVWNSHHLHALEKAASQSDNGPMAIHLKVNTGLNRLGTDWDELDAMLQTIRRASHLHLEGIFSHFASSEIVDSEKTDEQLKLFHGFVERTARWGLRPQILHLANSSAIASRPESWFNLVRPGILLFGYSLPFVSGTRRDCAEFNLAVTPVLTWKTRVIHTRRVRAGETVGYTSNYFAKGPRMVAVLSVGYSDGLDRRLSAGGRVIIHDQLAPIIGNVSMNLTMVDVTEISNVSVGDVALLIGKSATQEITAYEHAKLCSTIAYEVLCRISSRIPRVYVE